MTRFSLALHGGAGTLLPSQMDAAKEAAYRAALESALTAAERILADGGQSIDAVVAAVQVLEDNPLFNAGKGAVLTADSQHELDASLMNGQDLRAGAVCGVKTVRNPILLCKAVMDHSEHVMLSGEGAEAFARIRGLELVNNDYFTTPMRLEQLKEVLGTDEMRLDHSDKEHKFGTVGAVALDQHGNLAAATSTGGITNKKFGRIGDSPVIGSGTYANNATCAVSATGWGEFFLRSVVAYDVSCLMEYKGLSLNEATRKVIMDKIPALGGDGGLVAVDKEGNLSLPFNTSGMYRAWSINDKDRGTAIFSE